MDVRKPYDERNDGRRAADPRDAFTEALLACRDGLDGQVHPGALDRVHPQIVEFARAAHACGAPPERTVAAFKEMISHLPSVFRRPMDERTLLMKELVEMAIVAYYPKDGVPKSDGKVKSKSSA